MVIRSLGNVSVNVATMVRICPRESVACDRWYVARAIDSGLRVGFGNSESSGSSLTGELSRLGEDMEVSV